MKKISITKIIIIVCLVVVAVCGIKFIKKQIELSKVTTNMSLSQDGTEITGIWDEDNFDKYICIAIPNPKYYVNSVNKGYYDEYSKVKSIGQGAFQGNKYVETVYIPANIVMIDKDAFAGCDNLTKVLYSGTKEEWEKIDIKPGNDELKYVKIEYEADMPDSKDNGVDANGL